MMRTRRWVSGVLGATAAAWLAAADVRADAQTPATVGGRPRFPYCQIVDRFPDPLHGAELTIVPSQSVDDAGSFGLVEMRGWTEFGYFRMNRGELSLSSEARLWFPTSGGGLDLPDAWLHWWLRTRWDIRGYNGFTVRLEAEPGFYADVSALPSGFELPFGITGIQSFDDGFSGFVGLKVRPTDRRVLDPAAGLRISPTDALLFDIGYPDMRALLRLTPEVTAVVGAEWNRQREFELDDHERGDRLRYRESRLYGAVRLALDRVWHVEIRGGVVMGRQVGIKGDGDRDMEGGPFFTIGVGGTF